MCDRVVRNSSSLGVEKLIEVKTDAIATLRLIASYRACGQRSRAPCFFQRHVEVGLGTEIRDTYLNKQDRHLLARHRLQTADVHTSCRGAMSMKMEVQRSGTRVPTVLFCPRKGHRD